MNCFCLRSLMLYMCDGSVASLLRSTVAMRACEWCANSSGKIFEICQPLNAECIKCETMLKKSLVYPNADFFEMNSVRQNIVLGPNSKCGVFDSSSG